MGTAKRRNLKDINFEKNNHPVVTEWIQENLYPIFSKPGVLVFFDDSINLRVFRVPCAIPTQDKEIVRGRVKFSSDLISYQDYERILCYLKIENSHQLYLIENSEQNINPDDIRYFSITRNIEEINFNWLMFFNLICKTEGYYRIDHSQRKGQSLGATWDEATKTLKSMGHSLEPVN